MRRTATLVMLAALFSCNNPNNSKETSATTTTEKKVDTVATTKTETPAPPPQMDSATMMKKWQEYATPGDMHKMLASFNGKWNEEVTMWEKPDAPPQKSTAVVENKMVLGGRYQQSIHKGMMMGMPFEGMGTIGYDNAKKVFISSWIDNMGTGIMQLEGPYDEATKTITLKGKMEDPIMGGMTEIRQTFKMIDDKNQLMEMFATPHGGKEYKNMEIKLTKK